MSRIAITGIGLVSPAGNDLDSYFKTLLSKKKMRRPIACFKNTHEPVPQGSSCNLGNSITPENRLVYLIESSIDNLLISWDGDIDSYSKVAIILGSGLGLSDQLLYNGHIDMTTQYLSQIVPKLKKKYNFASEIVYIGNSCSAGNQAISYAMDLLKLEEYDMVIAGGADVISELAYSGFQRLHSIDLEGCRPFDQNRKGIMVGEGSVMYTLENEFEAVKKKRNNFGYLLGNGVTNDAYNVVQLDGGGEQIKRAMDIAITKGKIDRSDINVILAHGTGTKLNDKFESGIIEDYFADYSSNINITSVKGSIGHTGGASGAFNLLTAIGIVNYNYVPSIANHIHTDEECKINLVTGEPRSLKPHIAMINTFGFGGTNVVLTYQG